MKSKQDALREKQNLKNCVLGRVPVQDGNYLKQENNDNSNQKLLCLAYNQNIEYFSYKKLLLLRQT